MHEERGEVSKETAMLRWWESITGEFGIIDWVNNIIWPFLRVTKLTFRVLAHRLSL